MTRLETEAPLRAATITSTGRLGMTLVLAATVHGIVILGVSFDADHKDRKPHSSLDVVLVRTSSQMAPAQADSIAAANSQASGSVHAALRPSSPAPGSAVTPSEDQAIAASPPASPEPRLVTQMQARTAVPQEQQQRPREPCRHGEAEARKQAELERLNFQLSEDVQRYAQRPRVNYIDTLGATTAPEAA